MNFVKYPVPIYYEIYKKIQKEFIQIKESNIRKIHVNLLYTSIYKSLF